MHHSPDNSLLEGMNPADLLRQGMQPDTIGGHSRHPCHAPSLEELAPLFPELDLISIRFATSCIVDKNTAELIETVTMYRSKPNGQNTHPGPWKFYGYDIQHVL